MKKLYLPLLFSLFLSGLILSCQMPQNTEEKTQEEEKKEVSDSKKQDKQDNKKQVLKIMSWNLYNFGKSKEDADIEYMAKQMRNYDIVAIQEVSTTAPGAQALAKLVDQLNRSGAQWDYAISDPTTGDGKERYAYVWKPSKVELKGKAWLEKSLEDEINREPYMARFKLKKSEETVLLGSFHAVPSSKNPETEIVLLDAIPKKYPKDQILIMGDFNLSQKHEAFDKLKKRGLNPALVDQKTSLRQKRKNGEALAQEYDNIFYSKNLTMKKSGVVEFYQDFRTLDDAHNVSDHIPVWIELEF